MKRIVLLASNYHPESNAAAQRITSLAEALATRGWRVTVVAPLPHHPQNRIYEGYDVRSPSVSDERGVRIVRVRPWIVPKEGLALRLASELLFCLQAIPHLFRAPADVLLASSPYMFLGPLGLAASRLKRVPFVWDVRDLTWLYPRATGRRTFGLDALLERLMVAVAGRADALTTATQGLLTYFPHRPTRAMVVANGVSDAWLEQLLALPPLPSRPPARVLYAGLFGFNHSLATLIEAAEQLPDVAFTLAGDGPERAKLESMVDAAGLTNVSFTGYLGQAALLEAYQQATVLVSHVRNNPIYRWTQPAKLWEYMATGRPVIHAGEGEVVTIMREHGLGLATPPEQPAALAGAIRQLLDHPERARAVGRAGREFVVHHRKRSALSARYVELLEALVPCKR